jgi:hypothetical protein
MEEQEVATVLPKELRLGAPPTMPQARSYLFRQQSTLSSYTAGQQIQINIPRLQRSYLTKDSYLNFRLNGKWIPDIQSVGTLGKQYAPDLTLDDCGAWGLFERMEVFDYLGSTVLEVVDGLPQLMSMLLDLGAVPGIDPYTNGASLCGLGVPRSNAGVQGLINLKDRTGIRDCDFTIGGIATSDEHLGGQTLVELVPWKINDEALLTSNTTVNNALNFSYQYCIPLPSFLGFLSSKNVPLHNGFTVVLTVAELYKPFLQQFLAAPFVGVQAPQSDTVALTSNDFLTVTTTDPNKIIVGAGGLNNSPIGSVNGTTSFQSLLPPTTFAWNITDVNFNIHVLELGPVAESMLLSTSQGQPLILHTKAIRNYKGDVKSQAVEMTLPLNLNVASLTNIYWFMRPSAYENNINTLSCGCRNSNLVSSWNFQYGSTTLPKSCGIQCLSTIIPTAPSGVTWPTTWTAYQQNGCTEAFIEAIQARAHDPTKMRIDFNNYKNIATPGSGNWGNVPFTIHRRSGGSEASGVVPKFVGGLNLELAPRKDGSIICGLNTNGMNTRIQAFFQPSYSTAQSIDSTVDAYAEYDAFINISPGIATTVSF